MAETIISDVIVARLEVLEAQTAELAVLKAKIATLEAENVRLTTLLSAVAALLPVAKEAPMAEADARSLGYGCFDPQPVVVSASAKPQPVVCRTTRDPDS